MENIKAKENQNQIQIDTYLQKGPVNMGPWTSHIWRTDPRHLCFLLSRYKFCAKMLEGKKRVLEIGCGDALGIPVVKQTVEMIHAIDFEPLVVKDAENRFNNEGIDGVTFSVHDITERPTEKKFDAAYSLDVIEHISPEKENLFMLNSCASLREHAVFIIGTPNKTSEKYASEASKKGHINLKSSKKLYALMATYFHNTFIFSMNDEVIHTGYSPMAHYLLCIGVGIRS
ncbi:class I SAM-dependent methyltransferase [Thermodesulfobacteriota bacterium]